MSGAAAVPEGGGAPLFVIVNPPNPPKPNKLAAIPARFARDEFRFELETIVEVAEAGDEGCPPVALAS